jgi:hypothetical protein
MILVDSAHGQTEDIYVSASGSGTAGAVSFADEDIVLCNRSGGWGNCIWEMFLDGSAVGISKPADTTAFHIVDDDNILMAFMTPKRIGNIKKVDDSDIVHFDRTAAPNSAFSFFFDGSDVGLTTDEESIDAIGFAPGDGRLIISTDGDYSVPMTGGGTLSGGDEDLIVFNGTTGPNTSGDFELYFDGSAAGLNTPQEDVWGTWIDEHTGEVYITTRGTFSVGALSGEGTDIFICDPLATGPILSCATVDQYFVAEDEDFDDKIIDGLHIFNNGPPEIISDGGGAAATVEVDENTTAVTDVEATDDNDMEGAGLTYSLTGGADAAKFTIDTDFGDLAFIAAPDFENPTDSDTDNDYEVQVTVTDSGGLTDVQDVTARVINVNDGPPEITSDGGGDTAAVDVDENTTAVTDVEATDPDDSEGDGLTYNITGGADSGHFSLDTVAGVLTFISAPDYENPTDADTNNVYEVQVTVSDSGPGASLTDTQDISVTVININEPPTITSNGGGDTAAVSIDENTTAVTDVETSDPEDSEGAGLIYNITGGADSGHFNLDPVSGVLTFSVAPDFENPTDADTNNVYHVQVTVTDSGPGGSLTDTQDISVTVLDVLVENLPPEITTTNTPSLPENQTLVIDVDSTDDNDTEGAGLAYSLTGGADSVFFTLDAVFGVLAFISAPDFENPLDAGGDNVYNVQVTVTDSGPGGSLTDVQDLAVSVTNVNEAPTAADQFYNATGNVAISVPSGAGLVSGSSDPEGDTLTVNSVSGVSAGAIVSANPDGSFTYTPPAGFTGVDTFNYDLQDPGGLGSNTATASITVNDMVWFIDNTAPAGDGRQNTPFNTLAAFEASILDSTGDCIFIHSGSGSYTAPLSLENSQVLVGQGASATIESICSITLPVFSNPLPATGGTRPSLTSASNGINLANGNALRGLDIGDTGGGTGIDGTAVGTLTIDEMQITGTGKALDIMTGTLSVNLDSVAVTASTTGGISLVTTSGTTTIGSVSLTTTGGTGLEAVGVGTLNISGAGNTISSTAGAALNVDATDLGSGWTFSSISSSGSPARGISLSNLAAGTSFTVTGTTTIDDASAGILASDGGIDIDNIGAGSTFTFGTTDITNRNGSGIFIDSVDVGTVSFGNVTIANPNGAGGYGIRIEDSDAAFNFASTTISGTHQATGTADATTDGIPDNDGDGDAIFLKDNGGSFTINGGTLSALDADGIDLRNSGDLTVRNMAITDIGLVSTSAASIPDAGVFAYNLTGTNLLKDVTIDNAQTSLQSEEHVHVFNNGTSFTELRLSNVDMENSTAGTGSADIRGSNGFSFETRGTVSGSVVVEDGSDATGIRLNAFRFAIGDGSGGSGAINIVVDESEMDANFLEVISGGLIEIGVANDIALLVQDDYTVNYTVSNSTLRNSRTGFVSGTFFAGTTVGDGISGEPDVTARYHDNTIVDIRGRAGFGLIQELEAGDLSYTAHNNSVQDMENETISGTNFFVGEAARAVLRAETNTNSPEVRYVGNAFGTVTPIAGNGSEEGIFLQPRLIAHVSEIVIESNTIVNSAISSGEAIEVDVEDAAETHLTLTDNMLTGGNQNEGFTLETEDAASFATAAAKGNDLTGDELQFDQDAGTLTILDRDDLATDNSNLSVSLVDSPGTTITPPLLPDPKIVPSNGVNTQMTPVSTAYANLEVKVLDNDGNPAGGVTVTFTAPGAGASVTFPGGNTAVSNGSGMASVAATANATAGAFIVGATATVFGNPADAGQFHLLNTQ